MFKILSSTIMMVWLLLIKK